MMSRGREQQREAAVAGRCRGGGAMAVPRRGRWFDDEPPTTTAAAGAAAGRAGWRCRSCAAVAIADCVALGCCPCAVVSMLGLALVKAPLVVGRRCVGRLRRRRRLLLHKKRVRDVAASAASATTATCNREKGVKVGTPDAAGAVAVEASAPGAEAELAWLEEMYRVGHWGFGRVSFSGKSP
ncbi:uncharacterized protein LOC133885753 [Phragmites australis]|uniref:uncharacterized protein LOC133885753 n=1 Tax=Phragmites australis TaxID=29695 RepID=UPI002D7751B7|nr:uncharacterized protein LOC133885753 [Phragmites australis]